MNASRTKLSFSSFAKVVGSDFKISSVKLNLIFLLITQRLQITSSKKFTHVTRTVQRVLFIYSIELHSQKTLFFVLFTTVTLSATISPSTVLEKISLKAKKLILSRREKEHSIEGWSKAVYLRSKTQFS